MTALVPALDASKSGIPASVARAMARRSAVGDRQILPVHTKRTCRVVLLGRDGGEVHSLSSYFDLGSSSVSRVDAVPRHHSR